MVYSRNSSKLKESGVGKIALTGDFSNPDNDPRGPWATKPWKSGSDQSGTRYSITTPTGVVLNEEWMGDESTYNALFKDNRIVFPKGGNGMPRKKYFRSEREAEGQCASNWWNHELYGNNQDASRELEKLFGFKNAFSNPKPIKLIRTVISLANVKENDIVLDFFSGSATTAEAVFDYSMDLNCSFILVQLPENIDDLLTKATSSEKDKWNNIVEMLDKNNRPHTLDYIGFERIIRAAKRIKEKNLGTTADLGFKHYILKEPKGLTLDKLEEFIPDDHGLFLNNDILSDFGLNTVLTTWLIRDGYGFNADVKEIDFEGYTGYYIDKHLYLISPDISNEAIAAIVDKYEVDGNFNAENVVLFGYSFLWTELEELKINLARLKDTGKNLRINFDVRY